MIGKNKIAYIAGLFDGEGTVSIVHQRSPRKNNPENKIHRLYVGISNTKRGCLDFVKESLGIGNVRKKPISPSTKSHWKNIYLWETGGREGLKFLEIVKPFCIIKNEKIRIAIKFQKRISPLRNQWGKDRKWTSDYCNELRKLNYSEGCAREFNPCQFGWKKPIRERNSKGQYI